MSEKTRDCPFCGRADSVNRDKFDTLIPGFSLYAVFCDKDKGGCGAYGPYKRTEEEAIDAWNRRANVTTESNA